MITSALQLVQKPIRGMEEQKLACRAVCERLLKVMKTEKAYLEIMDQLEIIHAENCTIYNALLCVAGIDKKTRDNMIAEWDKRFQDERKKYN